MTTNDTGRFGGILPRFTGKRTLHTFAGVLALFLAAAVVPGYGQTAKESVKSSGKTSEAKTGKTEKSTAGATEYKQGLAAFEKGKYKDAVPLFLAAAEKGNTDAMMMYSYCLGFGKGIEQDESASKEWGEKAVAAGNPIGLAGTGKNMLDSGETAEGLRRLKKSADQDCVLGLLMLGMYYSQDGDDEAKSAEYFKRAAVLPLRKEKSLLDYVLEEMEVELPDEFAEINGPTDNKFIIMSQFLVGGAYLQGQGVEQDLGEALKWIKMSRDNGFSSADSVVEMLESLEQVRSQTGEKDVKSGSGTGGSSKTDKLKSGKKDEKKSSGSESKSGDGAAEYKQGLAAYEKKDYKAAAKSLRAAADKGNTDAMIMYGVCLGEGRGVEKDMDASYRWVRKAADAGDANAQALYGADRMENEDEKEGLKYLKKAADQGNLLGLFALGMTYLDKDGEESKGIGYLRKVAEHPLTKEKSVLDYSDDLLSGLMSDDEFGLKLDEDNLTAANAMIVISQTMIGMAYMSGTGVEEDLDEAKKWIRKAKQNGFPSADSILELIELLEE